MDYSADINWPNDVRKAFGHKLMEFWSSPTSGVYDNADNFREARIGDAAEEAEFCRREAQGCCGSFEVEWDLETSPPVRVRYGFNYGH